MPKVKPLNRKGSPIGTILYIKKSLSGNEEGQYNFIHEVHDSRGMAREVMMNESTRGTRKYYHEIIAFHPKDKKACTPEFMREFVERYIEHAYSDHRVYWGVHRDKEHPHLHICFSATKFDGYKIHFSGKDLAAKDRFIQDYCKKKGLDYLPELEFKKAPVKEQEKQIKKRKPESDKEICQKALDEVIKKAKVVNKDTFVKELQKKDIEISKRKTGVVYNGRTYRFTTLGFEKELFKDELFFTKEKKVFKKMEDISNNKKSSLDIDKDKKNRLDL